jgi:hypothetical protein
VLNWPISFVVQNVLQLFIGKRKEIISICHFHSIIPSDIIFFVLFWVIGFVGNWCLTPLSTILQLYLF